jgi:hypothetical protein
MAFNRGLVAILGMCVVGGCSSASSGEPADTSSGDGTGGQSSGGSTATGGGSSGGSSADGGSSAVAPPAGLMTGAPDGGAPVTADAQACDTTLTSESLSADLVIPSGKTFCVGPGVTLTATADITIQVDGVLIVTGTAASPAQFIGGGQPSSWNGIVVDSGGSLQATYATIRDAEYAIHTLAGSSFDIDYGDFGTSFKTAVLESSGKIDHSYFRATVPPTIAITTEVTIDDPNGSMTILSASPVVTNSSFIGASPFTDLVRIGGASSPVFDHVSLENAHCGFHDYGATNNSPHVTNSIIQGMSYGVMAYTAKPVFENDVFMGNGTDVGLCSGATTANQPVLTGDYFSSGKPVIDESCVQIGTAATSSATATIAGAGPVGL